MYEKTAVILAGGKGTRLRPYTIAIPKPLVAVGDYPILEIVIRQLEKCGFRRIILAVNHQAEIIHAYFGNGEKLGVTIEYAMESKPLGTMGPLAFMKECLPESFLVMNGDVLTDLNFGDFLEAHISSDAIFTISGYRRNQNVDFGVLHMDENSCLCGFEEKPTLHYTVSMGVYALDKRVIDFIPIDTYFGFDNLMLKLMEQGETVLVRPYEGYWNDIGRPSDYEEATKDIESLKGTFVK